MSPLIISICIIGYFSLLLLISWFTSKNASHHDYYIGNRQSAWYLVAFGLIGDSLSGVTFVSVPGAVASQQFSYMQLVFGYLVGYIVIARVLLPLYYKLNLTSIYSYLGTRFGPNAQKTGSFFFLISRLIGAGFRLFISATVLDVFIFSQWNIPFWLTVSVIILLILLYTYRGGIKTLVFTDTLQSGFLLMGVVLSIVAISRELNYGFADMVFAVKDSSYSQIFFWDWREKSFFFKQFFSGAFIAIVMTGLDQNMMQKNLSCRSLPEAQRNLYSFSIVLIFVNLFFVALGALLYIFATSKGIPLPQRTDQLFPLLALNHLGVFAAIVFILGITAATFSSADSVLTTLTTSFCIDFLNIDTSTVEDQHRLTRRWVHVGFSFALLLLILLFEKINNDAVINSVFTAAGYTYGPLLGLFAFGLFNKRIASDRWIPMICLSAPLITWFIDMNSVAWLNGYKFGFELLILNGALTYLGLLLSTNKATLALEKN
jgi:Na+/proline symporter